MRQSVANCAVESMTAAIADITELLDDSLHGLGQIGELIDNLKNFSRLDQGLMQKADLNQLVASALRIVQHVMRKRGHRGHLPAMAKSREIECAPAQINQVLLNLLNNAAQAIEHDHGRISVRTQIMGGRALVMVEDNGKGIEQAAPRAHLRPVLHDQGNRQGNRTGSVHRASDRDPAQRNAARRLEAGYRYAFPHGLAGFSTGGAAMSDLPTILFVDDEERILRSLRMLFRGKAEMLCTTRGQEAIDWVRNRTVHVVVSDQRMPGMTGVEILREVARYSPRTMRILLTGYADMDAVTASVNEGEIFRFRRKALGRREAGRIR